MSAVIQHQLPGVPEAQVLSTPLRMLEIAVSQNADIAKLEKLMELHQRWEANEARKAFVGAMAQFKAEPMNILKRKDVNIPGGAKFKHATLADVVDGVVANLSKYELSHKWITEQDGDAITVTCVITHVAGHSESTQLKAPPDAGPGRNKIQAIGSTITYLQRYTLMAVCGLAAKDMDNDGGSAGKKPPVAEPAGYEKWAADMEAVAEEGRDRLLTVWKASPDNFRSYAATHDAAWWNEIKAKSSKVKP